HRRVALRDGPKRLRIAGRDAAHQRPIVLALRNRTPFPHSSLPPPQLPPPNGRALNILRTAARTGKKVRARVEPCPLVDAMRMHNERRLNCTAATRNIHFSWER